MLQVKNINGGYGDETAIQAYDIAISETLGSLSTLQFNFVADEINAVGADMMIPRTVITEPTTGQKFRLATSSPTPNSKYRIYSVSANHIGGDLHDNFVEAKLQTTQSLKACMDFITQGTKFSYQISGTFNNYSFSEGFGGDYADSLLSNLASDFGFEFYFDNYTIHISKSIGKTDAFLFVDGANVSKISVQEDYSAINTYIKGYAGKPDEKTGKYPISAEYYSPLADSKQWGKIDGGIYTNENMQKPALQAELKRQVHDYPDVQYSVGYVDFYKNLQGFSNDSSVGNYGYLRDRFGIDVSIRVQARTIYPQEKKNAGSVTFGNKIFNVRMLQNQMRKGWQDNVKLGNKLSKDVKGASDRALKAWNARLIAQQLGEERTISVQDDEENVMSFVLTLPADNPLGLPEGTQLFLATDAKFVRGLDKAIQAGQAGVVTTTTNGLMLAADKEKLNGLEKYEDATLTSHGLLSVADKQKLDKLKVEPVDGVQIKDSKTGSIFMLTIENGEIKLMEVV